MIEQLLLWVFEGHELVWRKSRFNLQGGVKSRYVDLLASVTKQKRRKFEMAPTQRRRGKKRELFVVSLVV